MLIASTLRSSRLMRQIGPALAALALALPATVYADADPQYPPLTGDVVDEAHILSAPTTATLTRELAQLRHRTGHRLVIATVSSLQGRAISDYGIGLFRAWQVGRKGEDDGAVLLIAPRERQDRIEVGYRLEPVLTDAASSLILQQIHPKMAAGDYDGAALTAERAIVTLVSAPVDGKAIVPPPLPQPEVPWWAWAILLGFAAFLCGIFWIVFRAVRAAVRSASGARRLAESVRARHPAQPGAGAPDQPVAPSPLPDDFGPSFQADFDRRWAENAERIERSRAEALAGIEAARANPATLYTTSAPAEDAPAPWVQPDPGAPPADTGPAAPQPEPGPPPADPTQWGWDPSPAPPVPDFSTPEPPSPPPSPPDDSNLYTGGSAGGGGADDRW